MASPFRRAPRRSSHLALVNDSIEVPQITEGFLLSDHTRKARARIDYTLNSKPTGKSKRKLVDVPGYGGIKPAYGKFRDAKAEVFDDDVASYRHPRTQDGGSIAQRIDSWLHPDKLGKQAVVAMIDMMWERFGMKVTLVGHSMGGPNAIEGALRRPDRVADVVLLGSGGLEEGQNAIRLGKRMPKIAAQEGQSLRDMPHEDAISMFGQAIFHMIRNPLRSMGEAIDIAHRDLMVDEITKLRAHGVGVHAVQLEYDQFFPTHIAERDTRGLVDTFSVIEGLDHVGPQVEPWIVAEHIASVLTDGRPSFERLPAPLEAVNL